MENLEKFAVSAKTQIKNWFKEAKEEVNNAHLRINILENIAVKNKENIENLQESVDVINEQIQYKYKVSVKITFF